MRELSLHILDIVHNSLAAGASLVQITILEAPDDNLFRFSVEDNGQGMEAETVAKVTDPFYTTRTTRSVGLGLPMLKTRAESCGGGLEILSRPGQGTRVTATYQYNHIDRQPLGDISGTMLSLILAGRNVDFSYSHQVRKNGEVKEFAFNTKEMREILEDMPFTDPAVYGWLQDFLAEGEKSLKGEG
ncbi:MAG: ATP-binding protein [Peptococcaceae bacterium]|nr:ATP-binding protein [Peptococcaceae bacterium]